MSDSVFVSSDSVRSAKPLRYAQSVTFGQPLRLERGEELPSVTVAYETYGTLNAARDNAVLVCHALSGDSHVARHDPQDDPGWWELVVGPGKVIDTNRYFVICPNILGGCRGTTGPNSVNPATGKPYGADFPVITVGDMVEVQRRLIDHLGIPKLRAVAGGSLGGHQTLLWATRFPERVAGTIAIATSPRLTSQALAFDVVGRNAIIRDPQYQDGHYGNGTGPRVGLAIARMLGHITYLSREAMTEKFDLDRLHPRDVTTQFEKKFSVGSYLAYQGDRFVERFDANSYLAITMAMDLFNVADPGAPLRAALGRSTCRWLVLSFSSDWLFPPFQSQEIVDALIATNRPVTYCNVESNCGHDAFLLEDNIATYGEMIRAFLANLDGAAPAPSAEEDEPVPHNPTSIFHPRRLDYDLIAELIPESASVLDLGCGQGGLLARLRRRECCRLVGLELDEQALVACVRRGLDVVQGDLDKGLAAFGDGQFDYVSLSQTLQAVRDVEGVMKEMLRVGRQGIVSFPNFAYRKMREALVKEGRAPRDSGWLGYQWYNTPNIRFLSIADFEDFCREKGIRIHRRIALNTEAGEQVEVDPNLNADVAIFVISR